MHGHGIKHTGCHSLPTRAQARSAPSVPGMSSSLLNARVSNAASAFRSRRRRHNIGPLAQRRSVGPTSNTRSGSIMLRARRSIRGIAGRQCCTRPPWRDAKGESSSFDESGFEEAFCSGGGQPPLPRLGRAPRDQAVRRFRAGSDLRHDGVDRLVGGRQATKGRRSGWLISGEQRLQGIERLRTRAWVVPRRIGGAAKRSTLRFERAP